MGRPYKRPPFLGGPVGPLRREDPGEAAPFRGSAEVERILGTEVSRPFQASWGWGGWGWGSLGRGGWGLGVAGGCGGCWGVGWGVSGVGGVGGWGWGVGGWGVGLGGGGCWSGEMRVRGFEFVRKGCKRNAILVVTHATGKLLVSKLVIVWPLTLDTQEGCYVVKPMRHVLSVPE